MTSPANGESTRKSAVRWAAKCPASKHVSTLWGRQVLAAQRFHAGDVQADLHRIAV
jgi:hypothetical protein